MQAKAFVLLTVVLGTEQHVLKELRNMTNVLECYSVYGGYDIILKMEAETIEKIKQTVISKIRKLENVQSTLTMLVAES